MNTFMVWDNVRYVGQNQRISQEIAKNNAKTGTILAKIQGASNGYVVQFDEEAYVINANNLELYRTQRVDHFKPKNVEV
jgi:hypothetical protein